MNIIKIKWQYLLLTFMLAGLFTSCEFMSYKEYEPAPYDGAFNWTELVRNAEWGNRYDHAAVSFNDKIWVLGGYNGGITFGDTYYEDVWSSEDGEKWTEELEVAPWHGRRGHSVVVHDAGDGEAMYLIGGFEVDEETGYRQYTNDVWRSIDGKNWSQIKERTEPPLDSLYDWYPRMEHSCVVKSIDGEDFVYLVAGRSMREDINGRFATIYHNDVWRSQDLINWERIDNNNYGIRGDQAFALDPSSGRMYMQGGTHGFVFTSENNSEHPIEGWELLWYSDDGKNWNALTDTTGFDPATLWRSSHQIVYYNNSLWGFPGKTTSTEHYLFGNTQYHTIWRYHNNGEWEVDSNGAAFDPRHGYAALVHDDKVWILGGFTSNSGQANDVWYGELK
jgi:hypothetical protein